MKSAILSQLPFPIKHQLRVLTRQKSYQNIRTSGEGHIFNAFDEHKCLFIHIPKTGGVSVYRSLFNSKKDQVNVRSAGHFSLKDYEIIFGHDVLREYFTFTFVRNPWSRVLSSYQFMKKGGFHSKDEAWAKKNLSKFNSFNEFVVQWLNHRNIYRALHFIPQYEFLFSRNGQMNIDFIGKLENIDSDFNQIKSKLHIDCTLRHDNKGNLTRKKTRSYREFYTEETRDIVARIYCKDIEIFNYTF